ncbi:hypothetical protein HGQ17_00445 [Nesterenkonia sp. MY13]|uniref:Uncharacterized protein n=1 Tax=Nesterenkonia sedimenti TaxID=1463632 RepID=A0A7X8YCF1_9MICC|nr:hypothetical protein [Nesterenkonia sedimenti]NLS08498.1 hypothetical protein [Nesterenkonia sedimenti]
MSIRQLRIHGVGGFPGPELLGLADSTEAVVVERGSGQGRDRSTLIARRDQRHITGYGWGHLTSGSPLQPLWVLLLPFSLINTAGWAHHPTSETSARLRAIRGLVHLSAGLLTSSYLVWVAIIFVDYLGYQATAQLTGNNPGSPVVILGTTGGILLTTAVMAALILVAGNTRRRYEAKGHRRNNGSYQAWGLREDFSAPSFFDHDRSMLIRLRWHSLILVGTLAAVLVSVLFNWGEATLGLGQIFILLGLMQFLVILLLGCVSWRTRGQGPGIPRPPAMPAAAVTLAVALTNGVFSGFALLTAQVAGIEWEHWGQELALIESFVITTGVWAVLLTGWLLFWCSRGRAQELPERTTAEEQTPDGVSPRFRRRIAIRRGLAQGAHRASVLLVLFAATFLISGIAAGALRFEPVSATDWLQAPQQGVLVGIAMVVLPGLAVASMALIYLSTTRRTLRRTVAIIWDVLTFWPRRFHPFAVRPYSERVVPEFQEHIRKAVQEAGGVVVSAHSQGSVIAFASLAPLPEEVVQRVALVTYGSPVSTLYGQIFPAYCGSGAVRDLHQHLGTGPGWKNLYRLTDAIGGPVIQQMDPTMDQELPDPAEETVSGGGSQAEVRTELEAPRQPWSEIAGHGDYRREEAYHQAVEEFADKLLNPGTEN